MRKRKHNYMDNILRQRVDMLSRFTVSISWIVHLPEFWLNTCRNAHVMMQLIQTTQEL